MSAWLHALWRPLPVSRPWRPTATESMSTPAASADGNAAEEIRLFGRIRAGDTATFAEFYDRHVGLLFGVAYRILGDTHEAEDVLQEAAVLIWERAPLYDASLGKPLSWAVTLTRNKAIDRLRSGHRKSRLHEQAANEAGFGEDTEPAAPQETMTSETSAFVRNALGSLPAEQRRAIELAFFGGLTQIEIAEQLAVPLGTIKARIRRGMLALRDILEGRL